MLHDYSYRRTRLTIIPNPDKSNKNGVKKAASYSYIMKKSFLIMLIQFYFHFEIHGISSAYTMREHLINFSVGRWQ